MDTRDKWLDYFFQIINPVINDFLTLSILKRNRKPMENIEMFCRTILGTSIWFQEKDVNLFDNHQKEYFLKIIKMIEIGIQNDVIPWNSQKHDQLMVETALLALSFKRSKILWNSLKKVTKDRILELIELGSNYQPHPNNWMLFKSMLDLFLFQNGKIKNLNHCINYLKKMEFCYVGDGCYKDGINYHLDYYNSYVILPFMVDIVSELVHYNSSYISYYHILLKRLNRFSIYLERLISIDGTFPMFGRSAVYRTGVFHALAYCTFLEKIELPYGQIRNALTKVLERIFQTRLFDKDHFLEFGFSGYQPKIADSYSNKGSLYYMLLIFIPLGLSKDHLFWKDKDYLFTQQKLWNGLDDVAKDGFQNI